MTCLHSPCPITFPPSCACQRLLLAHATFLVFLFLSFPIRSSAHLSSVIGSLHWIPSNQHSWSYFCFLIGLATSSRKASWVEAPSLHFQNMKKRIKRLFKKHLRLTLRTLLSLKHIFHWLLLYFSTCLFYSVDAYVLS